MLPSCFMPRCVLMFVHPVYTSNRLSATRASIIMLHFFRLYIDCSNTQKFKSKFGIMAQIFFKWVAGNPKKIFINFIYIASFIQEVWLSIPGS